MQKCMECGQPLITASAEIGVFQIDSEPYESGRAEKTEYESIDEYVAVGILWCPEHGIERAWILEPQLQTSD